MGFLVGGFGFEQAEIGDLLQLVGIQLGLNGGPRDGLVDPRSPRDGIRRARTGRLQAVERRVRPMSSRNSASLSQNGSGLPHCGPCAKLPSPSRRECRESRPTRQIRERAFGRTFRGVLHAASRSCRNRPACGRC